MEQTDLESGWNKPISFQSSKLPILASADLCCWIILLYIHSDQICPVVTETTSETSAVRPETSTSRALRDPVTQSATSGVKAVAVTCVQAKDHESQDNWSQVPEDWFEGSWNDVTLDILTWGSVDIDSLLEPAPRGQWGTATSHISVTWDFRSSRELGKRHQKACQESLKVPLAPQKVLWDGETGTNQVEWRESAKHSARFICLNLLPEVVLFFHLVLERFLAAKNCVKYTSPRRLWLSAKLYFPCNSWMEADVLLSYRNPHSDWSIPLCGSI